MDTQQEERDATNHQLCSNGRRDRGGEWKEESEGSEDIGRKKTLVVEEVRN